MKKKILLLSTGGTIASVASELGLQPGQTGGDLLAALGPLPYDVTIHDILKLDSTNIQPEEWQLIASKVYEMRGGFDGVVITHGTDTMAYTASMLTFMLPGIDLPVVLTGSQLPITNPLSDAPYNLRCALEMAVSGVPGVFIAFDRKVLLGCRSVKVRTTGFNAFESVNYPNVGEVDGNGLRIREDLIMKPSGPFELRDSLCEEVFLSKLTPATHPEFFDALLLMKYKGVVVEAFGAGGLQFIRRNMISQLERMVDRGIAVVVCSQCLYERSDFTLYQTGRKALAAGVIQGYDMTSEAAVTKLMWALGQGGGLDEVRRRFQKNYFHEVSFE